MLPNTMHQAAINRYQNMKVHTSSPGEILLMLYDGLFRFLSEAKAKIDSAEPARAGERIDRALAVLTELVSSLRPEIAPELCRQLEQLYMFSMDHLVRANIEQDPELVGDVIKVLTPVREGFIQAVRQTVVESATRV